MGIEEEVKDAIKKRNNKKAESLFSKNLSSSFSVELYLSYLSYISSTNPDILKESTAYAYNRTMYNMHSIDIKIRYLEIIMEEDDPEKVKETYSKIVQIPMLKIETIIELYKNYESTKNRYQKKEADLLSKEATAVEESTKILQIGTPSALIEYIIEQYRNKYSMYTVEYVLYNIDAIINNPSTTSRNRNKMYLYKILLLSKDEVDKDTVVDKYSREIVLANGVSEKNEKISEMLWSAIKNTSDSLPLLFILVGYTFNIEKLLEVAPAGITKKSESFYLILFSAILKYKNVAGMRKYLIKFTKEKKIGSIVYSYCATVEGLIGGGNKYAGGILLKALKMFLTEEFGGKNKYHISPEENTYRLAVEGTKLLLSLGDVQRAHILIDLYNREGGKNKKKIAKVSNSPSETDPKLLMVQHQILYESGFAAVLSIANEYRYSDIFELLCRVYQVEEEKEVKMPGVVRKLIDNLPKLSENQNIFSAVDINSILSMLVSIDVEG
ncbi:hypothetical protein NEMIN01_1481 [Nematocida minor]|uniref:uncharacterized protein n=1 Tax=Nematocida minor TaxID=1912983 RepID=UPI00221EF985|nr:uncharacterized protein NEMIN01_1481 [Nematocida minor]KAI5191322.1 hypothetical protein NEMIN01_1481 [Nematocida minor]